MGRVQHQQNSFDDEGVRVSLAVACSELGRFQVYIRLMWEVENRLVGFLHYKDAAVRAALGTSLNWG